MLNIIIISSLSLISITAIIGFTIICRKAFERDTASTANSFGLILKGGNFLRIVTVIVLALGTIFLALAEKIPSQGVIAIFSSMIGYVLGSLEKNMKQNSNNSIHRT